MVSSDERYNQAWLMCAWTFSPYHAYWWKCSVRCLSQQTFEVALTWKQGMPCMLSLVELARNLSMDPQLAVLRWQLVPYTAPLAWGVGMD